MECPHVFGRFENLVGVTCLPAAHDGRTPLSHDARPAVVMLTPGMVHHCGPYRLHVHLARALARQGFTSFRFDLSGIGESLPVGGARRSLDRAAYEARQAMDLLEEYYDIRQFVVFGLCSGADDALQTALIDHRVVATVFLDGCGYRTTGFYRRRWKTYWLPRFLNPVKWWTTLVRRFSVSSTRSTSLQLGHDIREFPDQQTCLQQIKQLLDRGVRMRFLYTGGVLDYFNGPQQFHEMFGELAQRSGISCRYLANMDHVAILNEDRQLLIQDVVSWLACSCDDSEPNQLTAAYATTV